MGVFWWAVRSVAFYCFPFFQRVRGDVHDTQEKKGRKQRKTEQNSSPGFEKGINYFFLAGFPHG